MVDVPDWLTAARRICVLTGAGISTDSGIPDYRGPNGVWTRDPDAEKLVTLSYYVADPDIRRRAWLMRRDLQAGEVLPNDGHRAVADLERQGRLLALVTQNVDGLHQRAGSKQVLEVHGSIRTAECPACGDETDLHDTMPRCPRCGEIMKPGVVMFGELLPAGAIDRAAELARSAGLLLVVGSTLEVYPVAGLPEETLSAGGALAIVNRGATPYDGRADLKVDAGAGETLTRLLRA